jgi:ATP-dependent exoDNAse (exonuclease V) beta subunit
MAWKKRRRLAYVGITRAKKKAIISFSMNRFYQGDWIDSMASRFIEELPEKHLEKNSFLMKKLTMIKILNLIKILKLMKEQEALDG